MRGKKEEDEENKWMDDDVCVWGGEKAIMREGKDDEKRKGK